MVRDKIYAKLLTTKQIHNNLSRLVFCIYIFLYRTGKR